MFSSKHKYMIEVVIIDILTFFFNRAWMIHFIGPTKPTINYCKFVILIRISPQKRSNYILHAPIFCWFNRSFWGWKRGYRDRGRERGNPIWPKISDKSHYRSTQDASSSPGPRKGTFGTPTGIRCKKKWKGFLALMRNHNNGFIVLLMIGLYHILFIDWI